MKLTILLSVPVCALCVVTSNSAADSVPPAPDAGGPRNWVVASTSGPVNLRENASASATRSRTPSCWAVDASERRVASREGRLARASLSARVTSVTGSGCRAGALDAAVRPVPAPQPGPSNRQ